MIWPLRQASKSAEAPLWSLLDACGIPFRAPVGDWVKRYPLTASGKDDEEDYCTPEAQTPLFEGLDIPIRASVSAMTNQDAPPTFLRGGVKGDGDHRLNYAKAVARLSAMYGKGRSVAGSNSLARGWDFGLAQINCSVLLPEDAQPRTQYMFRDSFAEAAVLIQPAWRPALSPQEFEACAQAAMIWTGPASEDKPKVIAHSRDWPRRLRRLPLGVAMTPQGQLLVTKPKGITDIYLQGAVTSLTLNRFTPGPGGNVAYLYAVSTAQGRDGPFDARFEIARCNSSYEGLDALAETLAARLSVSLKTWSGADDYWPL